MSSPKVFAEGTLTIVVGPEPWPESIQIYSGSHKIMKASGIQLKIAPGMTDGAIMFPAKTSQNDSDLEIEQESRLLAGLRWLAVQK